MESLAAVGLVGNIIQFVDFSAKLISKSTELYQSNEGALAENIDIEAATKHLVLINNKLKDAAITTDDSVLKSLCKSCGSTADELLEALDKVKVEGKQDKWKSMRKALRSVWAKEEIKEWERRLARDQVSQFMLEQSTLTRILLRETAMRLSEESGESQAFHKAESTDIYKKSFFDIPSARRISRFVGCGLIFDSISAAICTSQDNPVKIVLTGIGGQGKTQTALEFCHRKRNEFGAIFWIDATAEECTIRGFERIAHKLDGDKYSLPNSQAKIEYAKDRLQKLPQRWLIVFDNYDTPETFPGLRAYFPPYGGADKNVILVISRNRDCIRIGTDIKLEGLTEDESIELLKVGLSISKLGPEDTAETKRVVRELGYLPLAIDQATAFLKDVPLHEFLNRYSEEREIILKTTPKALWEYQSSDCGGDRKHLSAFTTWELSFNQIDESQRYRYRIGAFLMQAAFVDYLNVSESLFSKYYLVKRSWQSIPEWFELFLHRKDWSSRKFEKVISELKRLSLIQSMYRVGGVLQFTIHPIVKEWLQYRDPLEQRQMRTSFAISMVAKFIQQSDIEDFDFYTRQRLLGHIDCCLRNYKRYVQTDMEKLQYGGLLEGYQTTIAAFYAKHDRYSDAKIIYVEALSWQKRVLEMSGIKLQIVNSSGVMHLQGKELIEARLLLSKKLLEEESQFDKNHALAWNTVDMDSYSRLQGTAQKVQTLNDSEEAHLRNSNLETSFIK